MSTDPVDIYSSHFKYIGDHLQVKCTQKNIFKVTTVYVNGIRVTDRGRNML
jgi:hypothetical protein